MVREDQVERLTGLRVVLVVPRRAVPAAAVGDLFGRQAEQEDVLLPRLLAPSRWSRRRACPRSAAPFIMNFMFPVPLAS